MEDKREWQQQGPETWIFGIKVRGIVRGWHAMVFPLKGQWSWMTRRDNGDLSGTAVSLRDAVESAERALGVI